MPNRPTRFDNWTQGLNNIAQPDRLPANHVRTLVNLDAAAGGTLELRAGYDKVLPLNLARAAGSIGNKVLVIDADGAQVYDTLTDAAEPVAGSIGLGHIALVEHNRELFFATPTETWRFDGGAALKPWGVPAPGVSFALAAGNFTGVVKVAVTALGEDGEESGCEPYIFTLVSQSITVTSTDTRPLRVYASPPNHETLYFQTVLDGSATLTQIRDETERLVTHGLRPFPPCSMLASHHGVILGAYSRYVVCSEPMMPHLYNLFRRFFQYASNVTLLVATEGGVFVGTEDATYFLSSLETTPSQRLVLDAGAVAGTGVTLPDGRAAWFTRYGQAIGNADGSINLINDDRLSPQIAANGAAGLVEHNGNRMLVTTMRGPVRTSGLGIGFHSDLETD